MRPVIPVWDFEPIGSSRRSYCSDSRIGSRNNVAVTSIITSSRHISAPHRSQIDKMTLKLRYNSELTSPLSLQQRRIQTDIRTPQKSSNPVHMHYLSNTFTLPSHPHPSPYPRSPPNPSSPSTALPTLDTPSCTDSYKSYPSD